MSNGHLLLKAFSAIGLVLTLGMSMNAEAGLFGLGGTSWQEEVLLHDGQKIIVARIAERGGRHEVGQRPAFREQSLSFTLPSTNQRVTWDDKYSEDIGSASFLPMQLEIFNGTPYLLVTPMGCLSYNKWERPNPPYVVFKFDGKIWQRIRLQDLPIEANTPNLVISSPDDAAKSAQQGLVSAEKVKELNTGFRRPEYKTILREALKPGTEGSSLNCLELVLYKGSWIMPNDQVMRSLIDRNAK